MPCCMNRIAYEVELLFLSGLKTCNLEEYLVEVGSKDSDEVIRTPRFLQSVVVVMTKLLMVNFVLGKLQPNHIWVHLLTLNFIPPTC